MAEMKRDALEGTLLEAEDVSRTWCEALANMRAKLLNLPAKAGVRIEDGMALAEREEIIREVVDEALEELSGRKKEVANDKVCGPQGDTGGGCAGIPFAPTS